MSMIPKKKSGNTLLTLIAKKGIVVKKNAVKIVDYLDEDIDYNHPIRKNRNLTKQDWIDQYGSGTLQKSQKLGFNIEERYLIERVKFEFGNYFKICRASYATVTDIKLVSSAALTELGWHCERLIILRPFESDLFKAKYIHISETKDIGGAIVLEETSAKWLPNGYFVYGLIAKRKKGKKEKYKKII